jgi:hypothetical protein
MRTLEKVLFFLVFAGLFVACNKDEAFLVETPEIDLKSGAAEVAVFMVPPSGGDDTPAIMQAFDDAKATGPGSVVQLCEGEYHLGFIEVRDFNGALIGSGKNKTIITAMNNLNLNPLLVRGLYPDLIKFVGGDVMISHLSMQTPPGRISVGGPGWGHILSLLSFSANNFEYEPLNENRSINVVVDNVSFRGQQVSAPDGYPGYSVFRYNCAYALRTAGDYRGWAGDPIPRQKIDIKITSSEFDTFCYGVVLENIKNGKVIIGEKNKGNVFNNIDQQGGVWEGRNLFVSIEDNTFNIPAFSYGLDLDDYPYYAIMKNEPSESATVFNVQNNRFNMTHSEYALLLRNTRTSTNPLEPATIFQIRNNQFSMADGYEWAILSLYTRGVVIRNNRFTGMGDLALYIVNWSQGGLVLGNNFSTALLGTGVAYLTASTSNWTFVGGNFTDRVINLGVNNVFTGMNVSTSDVPLGRTISEKLVPMNLLLN